jgi:hypothetical protein
MDDVASNPTIVDWLPPALMIAGVLLLGVVAALMIRSQRAEGGGRHIVEVPETGERAERLSNESQVAAQRLSDLVEQAQAWSARLDKQTTRLNALVALIEKKSTAMAQNRPSRPDLPVAAPRHPVPSKPLVVESKLPEPAPDTGASIDLESFAQAVCQLADAGRAPIDIARELKQHVGKNELILALRAMNTPRQSS